MGFHGRAKKQKMMNHVINKRTEHLEIILQVHQVDEDT